MNTIQIEQIKSSKLTQTDFSNLPFGTLFSDHMLLAEFSEGEWKTPYIKPYGPIPFDPAMSILHYGQGVFEGLKAFRYSENRVNIFRLDAHYQRFLKSCARLEIPAIPESIFLDGVKTLVNLEREWVPKDTFKSLYIRPFIIATDEYLGLKTSDRYLFLIICSPVGNYYKEGIKPVKLTTMPDYVRAVEGGVGEAKIPGNYAAGLLPTQRAKDNGFTQVLWLDAKERSFVEEVGTSNIFFVINNELITPPLKGSILPGITRDAVISLAKSKGMNVSEQAIRIEQVLEAYKNGDLSEVFASGTAAVISPVGSIHHKSNYIKLDEEKMGPVASEMYQSITNIHHGKTSDEFGWCTLI